MPTGTPSNEGISNLTNPEKYRQDHHWEANEVEGVLAATSYDLGVAVAAGKTRRIREITIRHAGSDNTIVTLLINAGATKVTIDVPANTTRVWSSQDGIEFTAAQLSAFQTSDVTGGSTFVSATGLEA